MSGTWQGLENMREVLRPLPHGDSHDTSLTVFSVRAQSSGSCPRTKAGLWGSVSWGRRGRVGVRSLESTSFYLSTWQVPRGLGKAPTLTSLAPLLELWDWTLPAPGRNSKAEGTTGGFPVQQLEKLRLRAGQEPVRAERDPKTSNPQP